VTIDIIEINHSWAQPITDERLLPLGAAIEEEKFRKSSSK
jgi:hypothetical protein